MYCTGVTVCKFLSVSRIKDTFALLWRRPHRVDPVAWAAEAIGPGGPRPAHFLAFVGRSYAWPAHFQPHKNIKCIAWFACLWTFSLQIGGKISILWAKIIQLHYFNHYLQPSISHIYCYWHAQSQAELRKLDVISYVINFVLLDW